MQFRNIDLSLTNDKSTVLNGVKIGEFRGNPTLSDPIQAYQTIKSNAAKNGRESGGVDLLTITGRNAGFAYLATTVGFAPTELVYSGTGIENLEIKVSQHLAASGIDDVQIIDISTPNIQSLVETGLFKNVSIDMASGRANICSTPTSTMSNVLKNLEGVIAGKTLIVTGNAPI